MKKPCVCLVLMSLLGCSDTTYQGPEVLFPGPCSMSGDGGIYKFEYGADKRLVNVTWTSKTRIETWEYSTDLSMVAHHTPDMKENMIFDNFGHLIGIDFEYSKCFNECNIKDAFTTEEDSAETVVFIDGSDGESAILRYAYNPVDSSLLSREYSDGRHYLLEDYLFEDGRVQVTEPRQRDGLEISVVTRDCILRDNEVVECVGDGGETLKIQRDAAGNVVAVKNSFEQKPDMELDYSCWAATDMCEDIRYAPDVVLFPTNAFYRSGTLPIRATPCIRQRADLWGAL